MSKTTINIGHVENINPNVEKVEVTFGAKKKSKELTFNMPTSPIEPRPYKPFKIEIPLMGADAHLCTLISGPTVFPKDSNDWYYPVTIVKGPALSNEFWEANGEKICEYIRNTLAEFNN